MDKGTNYLGQSNDWTRPRWFIGVDNNARECVVFPCRYKPTEQTHGLMAAHYGYCIGPYKTSKDAIAHANRAYLLKVKIRGIMRPVVTTGAGE